MAMAGPPALLWCLALLSNLASNSKLENHGGCIGSCNVCEGMQAKSQLKMKAMTTTKSLLAQMTTPQDG
jgi:hypothetical protein